MPSKAEYHFHCTVLLIVAIVATLYYLFGQHIEHYHEKHRPVINNKIFILYTGGTIGMVESPEGLVPKSGFLEKKLKDIVKGHEHEIGQYDIKEYSPLLDSSNMTPKDWLRMAQDIADRYDKYDAFIIIHGTDTMAYSASALAFMFENLGKPVIFTGSMIPLIDLRNDGRNNMLNTLMYASRFDIPEVVLIFNNNVFRGCRSSKVNSNSVRGFASPNFPPLGISGVHFDINHKMLLPPPTGAFRLRPINPNHKVVLIKLFPGIDARFLRSILDGNDVHGVVLETFGVGDAPTNKEFLDVIREMGQRGILLVNVSQCIMHRVDEHDYQTGTKLAQMGVISGLDMTTEAAIGKLYYLLNNASNQQEALKLIREPLRGELVKTRSSLVLGSGMFL
jgi:L-asparaginase